MLRKLLVLLLTFLWWNQVKAVVFLAPGADPTELQKYTLEKNQQTYTQWILQTREQSEADAHPQVLEFAQRKLAEKSAKPVEFDLLRQSIDLNPADREVLALLAEKLHLPKELCRELLLDPEIARVLTEPAPNCAGLAVALPKSLLLVENNVLIIDGKAFTKPPTKLVAGIYQWKIISDRYEDRSFTGTAEEFANHTWIPEPWVRGECNDYEAVNKDFALAMQSQIYFHSSCVKPMLPPPRTAADWAADHKVLLWGLGLFAAGVAAAQLKDKTLVITRP